MPVRAKTAVAAIGIVAVTLVGSDAMTYAGTGDSLILGKLNKSNKTTHVTSTGKGPALSLHAKGNRPALAVDSKAKIVKLNADTVDGKHAAALQNNVRVYTATQGAFNNGEAVFWLPNVPKGRYQATYDVYMSAASGEAFCNFIQSGASAAYAGLESTSGGSLGLSASTVIKKGAAAWFLHCSANSGWQIDSTVPIRVTLTRIDRTLGGRLNGSDRRPNVMHYPTPQQ